MKQQNIDGRWSQRPLRRREIVKAAALGVALPALLTTGIARGAETAPKFDEPALVAGAKKEGALIVLGNALQTDAVHKALAAAFRARYGLGDGFKVDFVVKNSGQMQKQVEDEIAADKLSADTLYTDVLAWLSSLADRGKLVAIDAPEYAAYAHWDPKTGLNRLPYYVSDVTVLGSLLWNTDLVKGNAFTSWFDVLRPEYKGKMSTNNARLSLSWALTYKGMRETPAIGDAFFEKLAKLEPVAFTLADLAASKTASGEYPITLMPATRGWSQIQQGAHVAQSFPKEGVVPLAVPLAAFVAAPHPNAARLAVNWLRSQEAQQIMAEKDGRWSGRLDIKSPNPVFVPSLNDVKLLYVDQLNVKPEEFRKLGADWTDLFGS